MKVLVTGGCGFIGSHLVHTLVEGGTQVRVLDDLSSGQRERLEGLDVDLRVADLRDPDACAAACEGVEVVYHQAAVPSVLRSVAEPGRTFEVNLAGTHHLLLAAREAGVRRVVLASSSSVYGDTEELPKHEGMPPRPLSPYAAQKASCEQLASAFNASLGLETVVLRFFNVFGPRQDPSSRYAAVVPAFVTLALRGEPATIYGDGEQTRDFTYVGDVVRANLLAGEAEGAGGAVCDIAAGQQTTVNTLHGEIARLTGCEVAPQRLPERLGEVRHSFAAVERAREVLGWSAEVSLAEGLRQAVEFYRG